MAEWRLRTCESAVIMQLLNSLKLMVWESFRINLWRLGFGSPPSCRHLKKVILMETIPNLQQWPEPRKSSSSEHVPTQVRGRRKKRKISQYQSTQTSLLLLWQEPHYSIRVIMCELAPRLSNAHNATWRATLRKSQLISCKCQSNNRNKY